MAKACMVKSPVLRAGPIQCKTAVMKLFCTLLAAVLGLSACATFPALDAAPGAERAAGTPPALLPLEPLLEAVDTTRASAADATALATRAAALQARAARLRAMGAVDSTTKARMQAGVSG